MLVAKQIFKTYEMKTPNGRKESIYAVNNVDFQLKLGEFCALVGESGSGKSTLSKLLMGLIPPTKGEILLNGEPISQWGKHRKELYSKIQMVLQDRKSSLDPRYSVYDSIVEPLRNLKNMSKLEEKNRAKELMEQMELPHKLLLRKPHELSGGQQKRVCIARALAAEPEIIIFDEAVSGLDVLIRKNILDLLKEVHNMQRVAYLFITHDMDVALYVANRILVMREGKIVEQVHYCGDTSCLTDPYSKLLLTTMLPSFNKESHRLCAKVV